MQPAQVERAIAQARSGRLVILYDGNAGEAAFAVAAERVTAEAVNFMATHGRGLVCLALTPDRMRQLGIPLMVPEASSARRPFGVSIEARRGVTTGISAADRARTIRVAVAPGTRPEDLIMPGHVFPLQADPRGTLARPALPEAAIDLMRMAGQRGPAALCVILRDDGELARWEDLAELSTEFDLPILSVADVIGQRLRTETLVHRVAEAPIVSEFGGRFRAVVYRSEIDAHEHIALVKGRVRGAAAVPVRVHSQCLTGDVLGSCRCDCGEQLRRAVQWIEREGRGVFVYLHQEGRGIGLANKIRAYALQEQGRDTVEANLELGFKEDVRDYGLAAQILRDLGVLSVRLITNNPHKIASLETYGIAVRERLAIEVPAHAGNLRYLQAKKEKLGHWISGLPLPT